VGPDWLLNLAGQGNFNVPASSFECLWTEPPIMHEDSGKEGDGVNQVIEDAGMGGGSGQAAGAEPPAVESALAVPDASSSSSGADGEVAKDDRRLGSDGTKQPSHGDGTKQSSHGGAACHTTPASYRPEDWQTITPPDSPCPNVNGPASQCPRKLWVESGLYQLLGKQNAAKINEKCRKRIYFDLGVNRFDTSLKWFLSDRTYGVRFTEAHGWEMSTGLFPTMPSRAAFPRLPETVVVYNAAVDSSYKACSGTGNAGAGAERMRRAQSASACTGTAQCQANSERLAEFGRCSHFNFTDYLLRTVKPSDFVVVKMDIEGFEFKVLDSLLAAGAHRLIDEMMIEFHFAVSWNRGFAQPGGQATVAYPGRIMQLADAEQRIKQWRALIPAFHIWV